MNPEHGKALRDAGEEVELITDEVEEGKPFPETEKERRITREGRRKGGKWYVSKHYTTCIATSTHSRHI